MNPTVAAPFSSSPNARLADLPVLPTTGVGSYAIPGWMFPIREAIAAGKLGLQDVDEAFDDATRAVVADQVEAGLDIISDGELRRQRFVYEMYDRLTGLERQPRGRRLGVPGYDMAPRFTARDAIEAKGGLGLVEELESLRAIEPERPLKIAFPGPLTFAMNIDPAPYYGQGTKGEDRLLDDLVSIVRNEVTALRDAGADVIQLDEPGFPNPPFGRPVTDGATVINDALGAHADQVAVHVCFGNNASRPFVRRDLDRLTDGLQQLRCGELGLEFANREMAGRELLGHFLTHCRIAAGVIDVKNFHQETPEEVAARVSLLLEYVPAERLVLTADCGFSAIPRWLARQKIRALVDGARLARAQLFGTTSET